MTYKVLIPSAGIGSRLKELTRDKNKALVKVNGRETISYIIEKFSKEVEFVIALGYKGRAVKDFLNKHYPDRKFTFVEVDPYDGPGSGLGYSISCCKDYLQCPFVFIPNDAIIINSIPKPDYNYLGYASKRDVTQFRSLRIRDGKVVELCEKAAPGEVWPYIGLAGIKDYKAFWESYDEAKEDVAKAGESGSARYMMSKGLSFKGLLFDWLDTGNLEDLKKTEQRLKSL